MTTTTVPGGFTARPKAPVVILLACSVLLPATSPWAQTAPAPNAASPFDTARPAGASRSTTAAAQPPYSASGIGTDTLGATDDADSQSATGSSSTNTTTSSSIGSTALRGGGMLQGAPLDGADSLDADDINQLIEAPQNPAETAIEAGDTPLSRDDGMGVRLGSFTLRPTVNESINTERTKTAGTDIRRSYLATTGNLSLTSDWARHALTVTGEGTYERNISGSGATKPEGRIDGDLRLDFADDTIGHVTGGYAFEREDTNDPNAVSGAATQAGVNRYTGGASLERDLGILRGTAAIAATRTVYGNARLTDGTTFSLAERDRTAVEGRLRLGYEISPALIPFIEATLGKARYDNELDASGYARSSDSYGGRGGVQFDFGEKLRGELGVGYAVVDYEDTRLRSLEALTADGSVIWSPHRGTDVDLGLRTTVQDSTTPGESGWIDYQLSSGLSHLLRDDLTGRLTASTTLRDFRNTRDELNWQLGAGLIWNINRYFDITANVGYEHTDSAAGADSNLVRAGLGISLRR